MWFELDHSRGWSIVEFLNIFEPEADILHVEVHKQVDGFLLISIGAVQLSDTIKPGFLAI